MLKNGQDVRAKGQANPGLVGEDRHVGGMDAPLDVLSDLLHVETRLRCTALERGAQLQRQHGASRCTSTHRHAVLLTGDDTNRAAQAHMTPISGDAPGEASTVTARLNFQTPFSTLQKTHKIPSLLPLLPLRCWGSTPSPEP